MNICYGSEFLNADSSASAFCADLERKKQKKLNNESLGKQLPNRCTNC